MRDSLIRGPWRLLLAPTALMLIGSPAATQNVLETWDPAPYWEVDWLPDLDADGFPELLVGNGGWPDNSAFRGRVYVVSGRGKQVLWETRGTTDSDVFGAHVLTVGDMNGDGFPDVAAAARSSLGLHILDGTDGSILYVSPHSPHSIAAMGDVDGDKLADVLLSSPFPHILLGGRFEILPWDTTGFWGTSCARIGDVDEDGMADFVVGNWVAWPQPGPYFQPGAAWVYSTRDGSVIRFHSGTFDFARFGRDVAGPGDLNGDGVSDYAISEPESRLGNVTGDLHLFDGPTGELISIVPGDFPNYAYWSEEIAVGDDVDGNGFNDLLVSAHAAQVHFLEGKSRETVYVLEGGTPFQIVDDWNGDGFPDLLIWPPKPSPFVNSPLTLFSGAPEGITVHGRACAPPGRELPRIGATGAARIGHDFPVNLSRVEPGGHAFLLLGPLGSTPYVPPPASARCWIGVENPVLRSVRIEEIRPGEGAATVTVPIPNVFSTIGMSFAMQWVVLSPGKVRVPTAVTRVLEVVLQRRNLYE